MTKRVVITGMGLVSPLGVKLEEVWSRLCRGESGITQLPIERYGSYRSRIAGLCTDFTTDGYLLPKEAKKIDRFTQFALTAAVDAVGMSGLDFDTMDRSRVGVIIGCGVGGLGEIERQQDRLRASGPGRVSPFTIPKIMLNAAAAYVSMFYNLHGPSFGVATACASANNAMIEACRQIQLGELDAAITGGTEAAVTDLGMSGFCAMRALSERNDAPEAASRPFDHDRDGFVIAEGSGVLLFEELEHAKQRDASILGEVLGYGVSTDGNHITQPDEAGTQAAVAMQNTLKTSRLLPEQIDYINTHGTSTHLGDLAETAAIKLAFGEYASKLTLSSTKSETGHLLGGSGGLELIFSLLAIRDGIVPPTINLENPDENCDLDFTPLTAREKKIDRVISNSFGFGGHNACVAVGRFCD
ncbi:MAG: beta-ketoacyl-ACP synthase II [Planctomycetia bacterium]|nr:beta-ketoacyl-ACP synthase II [Planctomycetia bacterium]